MKLLVLLLIISTVFSFSNTTVFNMLNGTEVFKPYLEAQHLKHSEEFCFVIRITEKDLPHLFALFFSLVGVGQKTAVRLILVQAFDPVEVDVSFLDYAIETTNNIIGRLAITKSEYDSGYTYKMYPELKNATRRGDMGLVATDLTLESMLANRKKYRRYCPLVTVTNGHNIYTRSFPYVTRVAIKENNLNMVATHYIAKSLPNKVLEKNEDFGPFRSGLNGEVRTKFEVGYIEAGCVVFKLNLLASSSLRFVMNDIRSADVFADNSAYRNRSKRELYGIDFQNADSILFTKLASLPKVKTRVLERALYVQDAH